MVYKTCIATVIFVLSNCIALTLIMTVLPPQKKKQTKKQQQQKNKHTHKKTQQQQKQQHYIREAFMPAHKHL